MNATSNLLLSINPTTSTECPSCRDRTGPDKLRPEKKLAEVITLFKGARDELLAALSGAAAKPAVQGGMLGGVRSSKSSSGKAVTKKLPQGLFHGSSRDAVKKYLERLTEGSSVHLKTEGDKETLERRCKDFIHLHNAQLDAMNPMTVEQVVNEIHKREQARINEAKKGLKSTRTVEALRNGEV